MGNVLAIAENLLISRVLNSGSPFMGRNKVNLVLFSLAGGLLVVALGFFITAAYIWLSIQYPPYMAAAIAGAFVTVLSLLCVLIAYGVMQYKRMYLKRMKDEITQTMQNAFELVDGELSHTIQDNPKTSVMIASLAGFIAGEKLF